MSGKHPNFGFENCLYRIRREGYKWGSSVFHRLLRLQTVTN